MDELRIRLTQKQSEFDLAIDRYVNTFFGGAKGGGKSYGLRNILLKRRFDYPGTRGVIFRKTYPELYNNHISPILTAYPFLRRYYSQQNKEFNFPNGSVFMFRHCQYERDLSLHQGVEYHDLGIEEVGEFPEEWFWILKGCNRSSIPGIIPRTALTGNPGGIGHKWLKRLFVDRDFKEDEDPNDFKFIQSRVFDNPAIMENDPGYIKILKSNKNPLLVKAYLEGSWDLQAGQFFDTVSRETHFIDPFEIPDHWERFGAYDFGYNHPAVFGWFAVDEDGRVYLYRELVKAQTMIEDFVNEIMQYEDTFKLHGGIHAGHDCWANRDGVSVAEKFEKYSHDRISLEKAYIDRVPGAMQVRDYLYPRAHESGEKKPLFLIFKNCPVSFDTLTRMQHDTKKPEDVLKVDADKNDPYAGDDCYDMIRYGLMSRPNTSEPQEKEVVDRWDRSSKRSIDWRTV